MQSKQVGTFREFVEELSQHSYSIVKVTDDVGTNLPSYGNQMKHDEVVLATAYDVQREVMLEWADQSKTSGPNVNVSRKKDILDLLTLFGYVCREGMWKVKEIERLRGLFL